MLSLAGIVLLAFTATNLDNLILLVGVLSRPGQAFASVLSGALLSAGVLAALCLGAAFAADLAPQRWIGYLGVVPIALGLRELYRLAAAGGAETGKDGAGAAPIPAFGVAGILLASSADTLGALLPLFAETDDGLLPVLVAVMLAATLLGCELARRLASSQSLGPTLRRVGPRLVPIALIAVGIYVLSDTGTDTLR